MSRIPLVLAFIASAVVLTMPSTVQAAVCGEAIVFNLYTWHLNGAEVTQTNPAQMGETVRYGVQICPAQGMTDNYGNSGWGSYITFDRGIDQGTHDWRVTLADGSVKIKTIYVGSPSPPPPPPPPNDVTCCITHGGGGTGEEISVSEARQYMSLPLNFGQAANNICWRAVSPDGVNKPLYITQGALIYFRKHMQIARWCAVKNIKIVGSSVTPDWDTGAWVSKTSTNAYITAGGNGATMVKWYTKVDFSLQYIGHFGLWIEGIYGHNGQFGIQRAGTT